MSSMTMARSNTMNVALQLGTLWRCKSRQCCSSERCGATARDNTNCYVTIVRVAAALWCYDVAALWCYNVVARGVAVLWHYGVVVRDATMLWHYGAAARNVATLWHYSATALWHCQTCAIARGDGETCFFYLILVASRVFKATFVSKKERYKGREKKRGKIDSSILGYVIPL